MIEVKNVTEKINCPKFFPKLQISDFKNIIRINNNFYYKSFKITSFQICGVPILKSPKYCSIVDFSGKIDVFKKDTLEILNGSYIFTIRPFCRNNDISQSKFVENCQKNNNILTDIEFYCESCKRVDVYQEIFFHLEIVALKKENAILNKN